MSEYDGEFLNVFLGRIRMLPDVILLELYNDAIKYRRMKIGELDDMLARCKTDFDEAKKKQ